MASSTFPMETLPSAPGTGFIPLPYSPLQITVMATAFTLASISTIMIALRLYCRSVIIRAVTADDWLMIFALINAWGLVVTNFFQINYGSGRHLKEVIPYTASLIPTLKLWYAYQIQYIFLLYTIKLSILFFYRRLSPKRGYRITIWAAGGIITAVSLAMLLVNAFECPKDPSRAWSLEWPKGCNNLVIVYYAMATFNIISDIVILLLPIPMVLGLQINKRKRAALLLIFSCGAVAVSASIVRINALVKYQHASDSLGDIPYSAAFILLWSQIEVHAALISSSAPALKPLLRSILNDSTLHSSGRGYYGRSSGYKPYSGRRGSGMAGGGILLGGKDTISLPLTTYHGHIEAGNALPSPRRGSIGGESKEAIIAGKAGNGIVRTTDVDVKVTETSWKRSEDSFTPVEFQR